MIDVLEKRMDQLENLIWEFPTMINTRFARFDTEFTSIRNDLTDNTARIVGVERALAMLQVDVRDMRGGVTRQLIEQDKRLAGMEGRLIVLEAGVSNVTEAIQRIETDISGFKSNISVFRDELQTANQGIAEILRRLSKP